MENPKIEEAATHVLKHLSDTDMQKIIALEAARLGPAKDTTTKALHNSNNGTSSIIERLDATITSIPTTSKTFLDTTTTAVKNLSPPPTSRTLDSTVFTRVKTSEVSTSITTATQAATAIPTSALSMITTNTKIDGESDRILVDGSKVSVCPMKCGRNNSVRVNEVLDQLSLDESSFCDNIPLGRSKCVPVKFMEVFVKVFPGGEDLADIKFYGSASDAPHGDYRVTVSTDSNCTSFAIGGMPFDESPYVSATLGNCGIVKIMYPEIIVSVFKSQKMELPAIYVALNTADAETDSDTAMSSNHSAEEGTNDTTIPTYAVTQTTNMASVDPVLIVSTDLLSTSTTTSSTKSSTTFLTTTSQTTTTTTTTTVKYQCPENSSPVAVDQDDDLVDDWSKPPHPSLLPLTKRCRSHNVYGRMFFHRG